MELFVVAVSAAIGLCLWSTSAKRRERAQSIGVELVWGAIPGLIFLAAIIPAAVWIATV